MRDGVLVDLTKLLGESVEVLAVDVVLRDLVSEFGHLEHCLDGLELLE